MKKYLINEIFYSLQGEGARAGAATIFIRFSGCNLKCPWCDTDHRKSIAATKESLLASVAKLAWKSRCKWVVFTGGEPMLQLDYELVKGFQDEGYKVGVESNGTLPVPCQVDHLTISPKKDSILVHNVPNEVRVPLAHGEYPNSDIQIYLAGAEHYYVSPRFDSQKLRKKNLDWCVDFVLRYPKWKLSVQQHKIWQIR